MRRAHDADFGMSWLMSMFHADWTHHGPTAAGVVDYHLWDELDPDIVFALRRDVALLLRLPSATIEVLWSAGTEAGPSFFSGGRTGVTSGRRWIETISGRCDTWLSRQVGTGEPVVPAEWDGVELSDAVLAEIEAAAFVPDHVTRALTECARRCTPDLALRLLLRAMQQIGTASAEPLAPEHYARLATLGSALRYGEFLVSEVRHLVRSPQPPAGSPPAFQRFTEFEFGVPWVMGFFHQDWIYDGPTAADVVAKHLGEVGVEEVLAVRRDAQVLLDRLPTRTLEVLWEAGSQYMPSFERMTGAEWTRTVVDLCAARLSATADVRPLTRADIEDGLAHRDAVVAAIEQVEFLAAEVRGALVECAHRCTPDLAFRVLLSVVAYAPDGSLSPARYQRMERLGSALHYGEFVVERVKYLVEEA